MTNQLCATVSECYFCNVSYVKEAHFWKPLVKNGVSTVRCYNLPDAFLCMLSTKGSCSGTHVPSLINKNCFGLLKEFFMLFFVVALQKRIEIGGAFKPYCRKMFNQRI